MATQGAARQFSHSMAPPPERKPAVTATANNPNQAQQVFITKEHFQDFLQRHPEVVKMLMEEMNQASTGGESVPRSQPANANLSMQRPTPLGPQAAPVQFNHAAQVQRGYPTSATRSLLATPKNPLPSSPFGVGEMQQAARTSLENLEKNIVLVAEPQHSNQVKAGKVKIAAREYITQYSKSSGKPVAAAQFANKPVRQSLKTMQELTQAIKMSATLPMHEILNSQAPTVRPASSLQAKSIVAKPPVNQELVEEIMPYAKKYAEQLGYSPNDSSTDKILKDTVTFYSRNKGLADKLKTLVDSLGNL